MALIQLIYLSTATKKIDDEDIEKILEVSRQNNRNRGVTGLLIVKGRTFMQALEGEETVVRNLYEKISKDPRHTGIIKISERMIEKRDFPDWTMGFKKLDRSIKIEGDSLIDFSKTDVSEKFFIENSAKIYQLFKKFAVSD